MKVAVFIPHVLRGAENKKGGTPRIPPFNLSKKGITESQWF